MDCRSETKRIRNRSCLFEEVKRERSAKVWPEQAIVGKKQRLSGTPRIATFDVEGPHGEEGPLKRKKESENG